MYNALCVQNDGIPQDWVFNENSYQTNECPKHQAFSWLGFLAVLVEITMFALGTHVFTLNVPN